MRIKTLCIKSFGKLKDISIEFKPGINIVYGPNEAGKTTIQQFIKAMLYGMNSQKKSIAENERKKYLPWDGAKAEGKMVYLDNKEIEYVIDRSFAQVRKEDSSIVYKNITGDKAVHIDADNPGSDILGISEEAFEKTIFIKQLGAIVGRDKEDEIMKKLINLQQSGDEGVSYHKAYGMLEEAKKSLKGLRKAGKLEILIEELHKLKLEEAESKQLLEENKMDNLKLRNLIKSLSKLEEVNNALKNNRIADLKPIEEIYRSEINEIRLVENQVLEIRKEIEEFGAFSNLGDDIEVKLVKLINEKKEKIEKKELANKLKNEILVLDEKLNNNKDCKIIDANLENSAYLMEEKLKEIELQLERYKNNNEDEMKERLLKEKKSSNNKLIIFSLLLTLFFLTGLIIHNFTLALVGIIAFILVVYGIFNGAKIKGELNSISSETNSEKQELVLEKEKIGEKLKSIYSEAGVESYIHLKANLRNYNEIIIEGEKDRARREQCLKELTEIDETECDESIIRIDKYISFLLKHSKSNNIDEFFKRLKYYRNLLKDFEETQKEYEHMLKDLLNEKIIEIEKSRKDIENSIVNRFQNCRNISEIEEDIDNVTDKIETCKNQLSSIEIAQQVMKEAFEEIQENFTPKLNKETGNVLKAITGNKYNEVRISQDYEVKVLDNTSFSIKDIEYFSSGTNDQIYFALRLAIINLIFRDERMPIILDDTFVQYDEERISNALQFLERYAEEHQIIIFTCRKLPTNSTFNTLKIGEFSLFYNGA